MQLFLYKERFDVNWTEDEEVQEEHYDGDENDEEDCIYNQPALWSATRTLVDAFQQRSNVQPEIDNCKSYTSDTETLNGAGNLLQSPYCEPHEEPTPFTVRSDFLVSGARRDSNMSTDCYDFLGLAAAEKNHEVSTKETKGGQFFGLADKVRPFSSHYHPHEEHNFKESFVIFH